MNCLPVDRWSAVATALMTLAATGKVAERLYRAVPVLVSGTKRKLSLEQVPTQGLRKIKTGGFWGSAAGK